MNAVLNTPKDLEIITIKLTEDKYPIAYRNKLEEIMDNGCTEQEAREMIDTMTFEMELVYHKHNGLFLVESEAIERCEIYSPYDASRCDDSHINED